MIAGETACAVAGINLPAELEFDGVNLLPFVNGKNLAAPHPSPFWSDGPNQAVRSGVWKMVKAGDHTWLFNLDSDIGETKNLAAEEPEVVEQLEQALGEWQSRMKHRALA